MIVYPIPAKEEVTIELPFVSPITQISVSNNLGELVRTLYAVTGPNVIDLNSLPSGSYTVQVKGYKSVTVVKQ